jgi:mannose-6-phosphate isomerase-like protein (cupin superfamily)
VLRAEDVDAPLVFVHRGVLDPKSGIGQHFHNECEEMFVILDGEAEFTIDGRTSVLKGPAGAPVRTGHSHALYNPTDRPLQWMNINVGMINSYDNFDLGDPHTGVAIDPIPQFMTLRLDRALLREQNNYHGGAGKVLYRRALGPTVFTTPWSYVDHVVIPPGASIGPQSEPGMGEVYYVMAGAGTLRLNGEGARVKADDTVPFKPGEPKTLTNTEREPLELMVIGVAHDMAVKQRYLEASAQPAGRVGR